MPLSAAALKITFEVVLIVASVPQDQLPPVVYQKHRAECRSSLIRPIC